jgi:hypothetical protein
VRDATNKTPLDHAMFVAQTSPADSPMADSAHGAIRLLTQLAPLLINVHQATQQQFELVYQRKFHSSMQSYQQRFTTIKQQYDHDKLQAESLERQLRFELQQAYDVAAHWQQQQQQQQKPSPPSPRDDNNDELQQQQQDQQQPKKVKVLQQQVETLQGQLQQTNAELQASQQLIQQIQGLLVSVTQSEGIYGGIYDKNFIGNEEEQKIVGLETTTNKAQNLDDDDDDDDHDNNDNHHDELRDPPPTPTKSTEYYYGQNSQNGGSEGNQQRTNIQSQTQDDHLNHPNQIPIPGDDVAVAPSVTQHSHRYHYNESNNNNNNNNKEVQSYKAVSTQWSTSSSQPNQREHLRRSEAPSQLPDPPAKQRISSSSIYHQKVLLDLDDVVSNRNDDESVRPDEHMAETRDPPPLTPPPSPSRGGHMMKSIRGRKEKQHSATYHNNAHDNDDDDKIERMRRNSSAALSPSPRASAVASVKDWFASHHHQDGTRSTTTPSTVKDIGLVAAATKLEGSSVFSPREEDDLLSRLLSPSLEPSVTVVEDRRKSNAPVLEAHSPSFSSAIIRHGYAMNVKQKKNLSQQPHPQQKDRGHRKYQKETYRHYQQEYESLLSRSKSNLRRRMMLESTAVVAETTLQEERLPKQQQSQQQQPEEEQQQENRQSRSIYSKSSWEKQQRQQQKERITNRKSAIKSSKVSTTEKRTSSLGRKKIPHKHNNNYNKPIEVVIERKASYPREERTREIPPSSQNDGTRQDVQPDQKQQQQKQIVPRSAVIPQNGGCHGRLKDDYDDDGDEDSTMVSAFNE